MLTPAAGGSEPRIPSPCAQLLRDASPVTCARQPEPGSLKSPEFDDLEIPDYIESGLPEFDIDELLQADLSHPGIQGDAFSLGSTLASSTSPEDITGSHNGTYDLARSTDNSLSDDMDWISYTQAKCRVEPAGEYVRNEPAQRPPSRTPSQDRTSTAASSPRVVSTGGGSGVSTPVNIRQTRPSPTSRTAIRSKNPPPCRCVGVTLSLLERIQGHRKSTSLCVAETALHSLKGSISQCQALAGCRSCPSPSRLMAFSVLLVEKMAGMLEDMASMWEQVTTASSGAEAAAEGDALQVDADGSGCEWAPIHLGQYRIDTAGEWQEVFGFLVLLQVRRLSSFLGRLRSNAGREGLESHRSALASVALRVQELQEALARWPKPFARTARVSGGYLRTVTRGLSSDRSVLVAQYHQARWRERGSCGLPEVD
ncbi:hypothetical protein KVR01_007255 [Diaporthe batatas]|uniref:uncharacterized protein n=1 Tax=Diaporthe batatas TaxID=748121 RepID=UPI001D043DBC|nr:uncharacterized protein KVR01_007255 [Diaporthe batatas]KAG8162777.1 hypothetical protein KVR01_007255 [Diaporthe batatas]